MARMVNMVLGVWLVVSAFLWPHSRAQFTNTWVVGALVIAIALVAAAWQPARYLNTALSVWLFVSALALPRLDDATLWNNGLVAFIVFALSMTPTPVARDEDAIDDRHRAHPA